MLILVAVSFAFALLMGLPTLTYFYAKQLGRNARLWFFIGMLLPGLATIILSLMPDLEGQNKRV